jgi:DNA-binding Lrp family transcriptional regulator
LFVGATITPFFTGLFIMKLDEKDHQIIAELRENARSSVRDIAKRLKLRHSTVHVRIQKLKRNNIIEKFTIKLNNKAIGENFIVFVFITTEKIIPNKAFNHKNIKEVFGITGEYDLLMKCKFEGIEEFNDFILAFRKKHSLKKTLTMIATVNVKEEL